MFLIELVRWYNLPYTLIVLAVFIYWLTVILGFFDVELFDFDVEIDNFLHILNIGSLPFSIWLSIFTFQLWIYSIIINAVLNTMNIAMPGFLRFFGILSINFFVSVILTKYITYPLRKLFDFQSITKNDFVGKECYITSTTVTESFGTAEVRLDGDVQILDIRADKELGLKKGDYALIDKFDKENDLFYVSSINKE